MSIFECNMDEVLEKIAKDNYEDGKNELLLSKVEIKLNKEKSPEQIADELEEPLDIINTYINQLKSKTIN